MLSEIKKYTTINTLLWLLYICLLAVLLPHMQWAAMQVEPAANAWVAWAFAIVFEGAVAGFTYALKRRIESMPKIIYTHKAKMPDWLRWWPVFQYRYFNLTALGLFTMVSISGFGNVAHAIQFLDQNLVILKVWNLPFSVYALAFGGVLPLANILFSAVLADGRDAEQEVDPAVTAAKEETKQVKSELKQKNEELKQANIAIERANAARIEAEQQFRGVANLVRYLFDKDMQLHERIRGLAADHPELSQNRIAGIIGCSVSTVNGVLSRMEVIDAG